ncbi:MAG: hypothetical protein L3K02_05790, partial [Thermoplasmata archaeon]|nr:hypothetical protein [Thermoplasmata archaeon]
LPAPGTPGQVSFRGALLGLDPPVSHVSGIPAAVSTAPMPTPSVLPTAPLAPSAPTPWTGGYPTPSWTTTIPATAEPSEVAR